MRTNDRVGGDRVVSRRSGGSGQNRRARRLTLESLEPRWCPALTVPAFSSLPGANHTIYLDFDGHVTENTSWNSYFGKSTITSPAYNTDGDAANFSSSELAEIEQAWQRVAEDFLPFQVNVTTVDPGVESLRKSGGGDAQWGVRVVVTTDNVGCGCGGIAYVDSFNWSSDTPAFVYVTGGKYAAEAASHEAGHTLGLSHDGTAGSAYYGGHGSGDTSWAPLMGVGYYNNVTQWDRGEYTGTNNGGSSANYGKGPDDLAIISTYNGFGYRPDDHGNSISSATPLTVSDNAVSGAGIITTRADADAFSFTTGAGLVSLSINPAALGANLDIRADLYDAAGNLVASSNPLDRLNASFSLTLAAGTYYLKIDGTGVGNPSDNPPTGYSDYASIGQFTIQGLIVSAPQLPSLTIDDVVVNEAASTATFTVSLSGTIEAPVTVDYATADGTATAGSDYTASSGTLTFVPGGDTTQRVTVSIADDAVSESSETFAVRLLNASTNSVIAKGQGDGTILDNDASLSVGDYSAREGTPPRGKKNSSTPKLTSFTFNVTLSNAVGSTVTVAYATQDGSALLSNGDYQEASGTLTFAPGETSKTIIVSVVADKTVEPNETFSVVLSGANGASLLDGTGAGTILNDDSGTAAAAKTPSPILNPNPGAIVERDLPLPGELVVRHADGHDHAGRIDALLIGDQPFVSSGSVVGRNAASGGADLAADQLALDSRCSPAEFATGDSIAAARLAEKRTSDDSPSALSNRGESDPDWLEMLADEWLARWKV